MILRSTRSYNDIISAIVNHVRNFRPGMIHLSDTRLVVNPVKSLDSTVSTLVDNVNSRSHRRIRFMLATFQIRTRRVLRIIGRSNVLVRRTRSVNGTSHSRLLRRQVVRRIFLANYERPPGIFTTFQTRCRIPVIQAFRMFTSLIWPGNRLVHRAQSRSHQVLKSFQLLHALSRSLLLIFPNL